MLNYLGCVTTSRHKPKKVSKSTYRPDVKKKCPDKLKVNKILQKYGKLCNRKKGHAIVLDTKTLLTTVHLMKAGFKQKNIHVPNPFDYTRIKRRHKNTYDMLLGDFLEHADTPDVSLAFFDYCASLEGNDKIRPKKDIKTYFKYGFPLHESIFAVTLSVRGGRNGKLSGVGESFSRLHHYVTKTAYENGYTAIPLPDGFAYKGGMNFAIYKIFKN